MLKPWQAVILCALALLTIGVVMVNSAGMNVVPVSDANRPHAGEVTGITLTTILTSRSAAFMAAAILAMIAASFMPVRWISSRSTRQSTNPRTQSTSTHWIDPALACYAAAIALTLALVALVYVPGLTRTVNGATRWVSIPGIGIGLQPSELAKWIMPAVIAYYAVKRARQLSNFFSGLAPALLGLGAVAGMVILEDLGTGLLIAAVGGLILLAAGARVKHFALFVPVAALGLIAAIITSPYRVRRLTTFLDPYGDPQGAGYHMIQSLTTVAGGEGWGRGLGHGLQKFGYLPEDTTDFLFAVITEELGIAGAAIVIALMVGLLATIYSVVRAERDPLLKLYALGVLATIGTQAAMNLLVVTGMAPTKGIALPLVSAGGTGWILTAASLGLVVAIDRTRKEQPQPDTNTKAASMVHVVPDPLMPNTSAATT